MALDRTALATCALWVVVVLVHALATAFYSVVAYVYRELPHTVLSTDLAAFELVISTTHFPVIIAFHALCAAAHAALLLEMGVQSIRHRTWFFHRHPFQRSSRTAPAPDSTANALAVAPGPSLQAFSDAKARTLRTAIDESFALSKGKSMWESSFGYSGFFGVNGKHFTLFFLVRESIEVVLQSVQALMLSRLVPRVWLNRLAVYVVTIGCWSTPVIQRLCATKPRLELILCLLVDVALDFVSSIGVPTALAMVYWPDYDAAATNFPNATWFDLTWYAHMMNEFNLLFIQSWYDFSSRVLFALTLLASLDDVKFLAADPKIVIVHYKRVASESKHTKWMRRIETSIHVVLLAWGCFILGLHVDAARGRQNIDCTVQARPWLTPRPACAFVDISCLNHTSMVGAAAEVERIWSAFEPTFVSIVSISNCPALHMPPSLQQFTNIGGLYLSNVTMLEWSESAALTKHHHPRIHHFVAVHVDMRAFGNGSTLPPGIVSRDFPPTLRLIFIALCKLQDLPSDLHERWPAGASLILGANYFTHVPVVLLRMNAVRLILNFNPIRELPAALFELPTLSYLELELLPITSFPTDVHPSPALRGLLFPHTQVTALPPWMLTSTFTTQVTVRASGTPFCKHLQQHQDAESAHLAAQFCAS